MALSLAAVYAVFWIGGRLLLTQTYQWASVDEYQYVLDRQTRSTGSNSEDSFAEGAAELLKAPRTTLGLFPSYDEDRVERAIGSLREAYASTDDSFQRAEIAFFLAKAHLMKKDVAEARRWLGEIIALDVADYRAEAEQLLEAMSNADAADRRPR